MVINLIVRSLNYRRIGRSTFGSLKIYDWFCLKWRGGGGMEVSRFN